VRDLQSNSNIEDQTVVKIVLAYSGGLDTSSFFAGSKITTTRTSSPSAPTSVRKKNWPASRKSAEDRCFKCIIEDLQEEFARDFIFPMFQAGALYENQYFLGTSIARPLIATNGRNRAR